MHLSPTTLAIVSPPKRTIARIQQQARLLRLFLNRSCPTPSLSSRSYSHRRSGGVRALIAKRGLGLNSSSGLVHLHPPRSTNLPASSSGERKRKPRASILARLPLIGGLFGARASSSSRDSIDTNTKAQVRNDSTQSTSDNNIKAQDRNDSTQSTSDSTSKAQDRTDSMSYPHNKSDSEWRAALTPAQYRILRQSGTEARYTSLPHLPSNPNPTGTFNCVGCDTPLYVASTKFNSGCGWPAFYEAVEGNVLRKVDRSLGMTRTEITCAGCGGHLGHVFKGEGFDTPTDERHCVNGIVLKFAEGEEGEGKEKVMGQGEGEEGKAKV